ncbi:hypothetical protein Tco_0599752 [Tanacetum coccineum]
MVGYRRSDKTLEGKDHRRCLPRTSIPARPGWFACIHQPRGILRSSRRLGCIASEIEETFMVSDMSSHRSSWYWKYSSIRFHPSSSVLEMGPDAFDRSVISSVSSSNEPKSRLLPPNAIQGSPIPIGDGDEDVKRFPDEDGGGDGDEDKKQGWGW